MTQGELENLPSAFVAENLFSQKVQVPPSDRRGEEPLACQKMGRGERPRKGAGFRGLRKISPRLNEALPCLIVVSLSTQRSLVEKTASLPGRRVCPFKLSVHPRLFLSPARSQRQLT